jgi:outer membrane protein insertion porin family
MDPYFTIDGVSRGYSLFFKETKISDSLDLSSYATDRLGGRLTFGYPVSETQRLSFGLAYQNIRVFAGRRSSLDVWDFIHYDHVASWEQGDLTQSDRYDLFTLNGSWSQNALNRGVFPTKGYSQQLGIDISIPGSELEYYRVNYNGQVYFPLPRQWVLKLNTDLGYGNGYGDLDRLPFFEHFYAGGFGSVRGYVDRTLGPRERQSDYDFGRPQATGGNLLVQGNFELIFPLPWIKDNRSIRTAFFFDWGNVFDTRRRDDFGLRFKPEEFRYSVGVGLSWLTGIGPLAFSLAKPFNEQDHDQTRSFQFSLGMPF